VPTPVRRGGARLLTELAVGGVDGLVDSDAVEPSENVAVPVVSVDEATAEPGIAVVAS